MNSSRLFIAATVALVFSASIIGSAGVASTPGTVIPKPLVPDLIPVTWRISSTSGYIEIQVKNQGTAAVSISTYMTVYFHCTPRPREAVVRGVSAPPLAAGRSAWVRVLAQPGGECWRPDMIFEVNVDASGQVKELIETNNLRVFN